VCGEPAALGDWDPARAKPMSRSGDEWRTVVAVAPTAALAFKFLRRDADGSVTWEAGDNRTVPAAARVEAVWR
jgi:alpha-amylase